MLTFQIVNTFPYLCIGPFFLIWACMSEIVQTLAVSITHSYVLILLEDLCCSFVDIIVSFGFDIRPITIL